MGMRRWRGQELLWGRGEPMADSPDVRLSQNHGPSIQEVDRTESVDRPYEECLSGGKTVEIDCG